MLVGVSQDALLLHIVPIYDAKDWVSIAKHMGGEVTNEQCRNRYYAVLLLLPTYIYCIYKYKNIHICIYKYPVCTVCTCCLYVYPHSRSHIHTIIQVVLQGGPRATRLQDRRLGARGGKQ